MPEGRVYEVALLGSIAGKEHVNLFHFVQSNVAPAMDELAQLDADVRALMLPGSMFQRHSDYQLGAIDIQEVEVPTRRARLSTVAGIGGQEVGQALPTDKALLISFSTSIRSRRAVKRTFLGGWSEAAGERNTVSPAIVDAYGQWANGLVAKFDGAGGAGKSIFRLVAYSPSRKAFVRYHPKTGAATNYPARAYMVTPITGAAVHAFWHDVPRRGRHQ